MIIFMCDILCVTNRKLCKNDFLERIRKIADEKPRAIILREKDLTEEEYTKLAAEVIEICKNGGVECILHNFVYTAEKLHHTSLHLPLSVLEGISADCRKKFKILGASCHSAEDAINAQKLGCTYITAGHIFDTDCKKGLPGRGLDFLKKVCRSVSVPVYAIGGISTDNISDVIRAGAAGGCIMSGAMNGEFFEILKEKANEIQ